MPLRDICQDNVVTIEPNATLLDAARLMKDRHLGNLIVVDRVDGTLKPVGVITDRDIALSLTDGKVVADTKVEVAMSRNPKVAFADDGIAEVIALMSQYGVRRLPVIDHSGALVGVVSTDDLMRLMATEMTNLAAISARQISREGQAKELTVLPESTDTGLKPQRLDSVN